MTTLDNEVARATFRRGQQDVLDRIEAEAVAARIDELSGTGSSPASLDRLVALLKSLSDTPVSWQQVYDRIDRQALHRIEAERAEQARQVTGS